MRDLPERSPLPRLLLPIEEFPARDFKELLAYVKAEIDGYGPVIKKAGVHAD